MSKRYKVETELDDPQNPIWIVDNITNRYNEYWLSEPIDQQNIMDRNIEFKFPDYTSYTGDEIIFETDSISCLCDFLVTLMMVENL